MARIQFTDDAREDLRHLDGSARMLVLKALRKLEQAPRGFGEPLGRRAGGNLTGFRQLVVGRKAYRIIRLVDQPVAASAEETTVVVVWLIAERSDARVYELALARLRAMRHSGLANELEQLLIATWRG